MNIEARRQVVDGEYTMKSDANEHKTRPGWDDNVTTGLYIRHVDDTLGAVWRTWPDPTWSASVHVGARQATGRQFATITAAQVWCEDMIARFVAADRRTKEREGGCR